MKLTVSIFLLLFCMVAFGEQIEIRMFGSTGCPQCERVENGIIKEDQRGQVESAGKSR